MARSPSLVATSILIAAIVGLSVWAAWNAEPHISLSKGEQIRVRKVTFGTNHVYSLEPVWKHSLRHLLPQHWQKPLGPSRVERVVTPHPSLVLWLDQYDRVQRTFAPIRAETFEAVMPDGSLIPGKGIRRNTWQIWSIEFDIYDRAARQIPMRFHDGTNLIPFAVDNPRTARKAEWTALPLPQTGKVDHAGFVLHRVVQINGNVPTNRGVEVTVREMKASSSAPMGWPFLKTTIFDSTGNWVASRPNFGGRNFLSIPCLSAFPTPWKILVEGDEYLTTGFVTDTTPGSVVSCELGRRLCEFGIQMVLFTSVGAFQIAENNITNLPYPPQSSNGPAVTFSRAPPQGSRWSVNLVAPRPGILCISDVRSPPFRARMRDRIRGPGERMFDGLYYAPEPVTNAGHNLKAAFFAPHSIQGRTNLEIEIVARIPSGEFFVDPQSNSFGR